MGVVKTVILDLTSKGYPVVKINERYVPLFKEVLSEQTNSLNITNTAITKYKDIFNLCCNAPRHLFHSLEDREIQSYLWAFEKLYKHDLTITADFKKFIDNNKELSKAYKLFIADRKKRRMIANKPKCHITFANKPSEKAIENMHMAIYEILLDKMEREYGHR